MKVTKKVTKKMLLLALAITMLLTTAIPAYALPGNTVVIGGKAFSMDYFFDATLNAEIAAAIRAGGDIYFDATNTGDNFKDAWTGKAITNEQKAALNNIEYLQYDGKKVTYAKFPDKTPITTELSVKSYSIVNATTLKITFSNNVTQDFTVETLVAGENTRVVKYLDKDYSVKVNYIPPVLSVEAVKELDYRHFQVIFTGVVDLASAKKAENYYFFINEGNADYKSLLPASNQLDTIVEKIDANNVNGKTIVDIYLPEDDRFTNIADFLPQMANKPTAEMLQQIPWYVNWPEPYGFDTQAWIDDEQSIVVNLANDVHGVNSNFWTLTKGREVQVAIRNIRDAQLQRSIDTAVLPMLIKDETRPSWTGVKQVENTFVEETAPRYGTVPEVPVYTDGSEMIRMSFSEPVFNTHGLGVGDIGNTGHYNVEVAVDDNKVASTDDQTLGGILNFYMGKNDSHAQSCLVDLNIKAAIERAYTDGFRADNTYTIKITGITDLAGNITNPQVVEFKVSLRDPNGSGGIVIPAPKIIDVRQIHDNVFRVYMNRNDVSGIFEIRNGDGEDGLIKLQIADFPAFAYSKKINDQKVWYRDIFVSAVDMEKSLGVGVKDDQLLAYDRQNTLKRTLRICEVADTGTDGLTGNSFERSLTNGNEFTINKDIYAPEVVDPEIIPYKDGTTGTTITLNVKDIVPSTWAVEERTAQPVYAMLYDYAVEQQFNNLPFGRFDFNSIDTAATEAYNLPGMYANITGQYDFDLLPIVVSYTKDGVKHTAVVSNRCLLNEFANDPGESGRHYGAPGSISYNFAAQQLTINLTPGTDNNLWYRDLLDSNGKLVQGVNYEIEIPNGYFADQARFNAYNFKAPGVVDTDKAVYFAPADGILYVSDGRNNNNGKVARPYDIPAFLGDGSESYMVHGYTSAADKIIQAVDKAPVVIPEPKDAVPQTSKELINWHEDKNEIWVEFTGSIDVATLKNPANYVLNDLTLAAMGVTADGIQYVVSSENKWNGEDRQFAVIKLPYDTITVDGDYEFKVSGVSNAAGGTMTPVSVRLDINENFRPVIEKAVVIGNHEIELTFNESVRYTADPAINPEQLAVASKDNFVVYVNGAAFTPMTATVGTTPLTPNDNPNPTYPLNKVVRLNLGSVELLGDTVKTITVDVVKNQNNKLLMEDSKCNPLNDVVAPFVVK